MKNELNPSSLNRLLGLFPLLGCLEFSAAAVWILSLDPDPKNAIFLGYSLQRLALFGLTFLPALLCLALALAAWRGKAPGWLERWVRGNQAWQGWVACLLALLALLIWVTPAAWLGPFGGYYRRLQPLCFVLCLFPGQLTLLTFWRAAWRMSRPVWFSGLVFIAILLAGWVFVFLTGYGITPEKEFTTGLVWNLIAATPLTMFQWFLIWLTLLGAAALLRLRRAFSGWLDGLLALGLYLITILAWVGTPFKESTFAAKLAWPAYQPFPQSDALIHDLGALSILHGQGIYFGEYTDKPLYMAFLAFLHLFSGYHYTWLVYFQIAFLALMVPAAYFLGKAFHSRLLGLALALLLLIRQVNAIALTSLLYYNAAPNLLLTEVPTLLGLVLLVGLWFAWLTRPRAWLALAAGGMLGALSLVRLNPVLLLPVLPFFVLIPLWREKKRWLGHVLVYLLGFSLLIAPWVLTGVDSDGHAYFFGKFYDVFSVRYGESHLPMEAPSRAVQPAGGGLFAPATKPQPASLDQFPGFVLNHFLHNLVGSLLVLPDSLSPARQSPADLADRFYWKPETFERERLPWVALNSLLVALGLAWSWRRWQWAGLAPGLVFLVYSLSLALARTSGSRYLVPIDWILCFYFALGALTIFRRCLPASFGTLFETVQPVSAEKAGSGRLAFGAVLTALVLLAAVIPVADNWIPVSTTLCAERDLPSLVAAQRGQEIVSGLEFRLGRVLYPVVEQKSLHFNLFTCRGVLSAKLDAPFDLLESGELIILGWSAGANPSETLPATLVVPVQ